MKLELQGITKTFGSLVANDHIDLVVEPGEIHALLGENGAGKSTLMNVLYGLYDPDGGQILVDDAPVTFAGPGDAMAAGIGMVHQHFMLVPGVHRRGERGPRPRARARRRADRPSRGTSPGQGDLRPVRLPRRPGRLHRGPARRRPAARRDHQGALPAGQGPHPRRADGRAHAAGDRRADRRSCGSSRSPGRRSSSSRTSCARSVPSPTGSPSSGAARWSGSAEPTSSETELASLMVGRSVSLGVARTAAVPGEATVQVRHLTVIDEAGVRQLDDISFDVSRGEIVSIAGVQGNGQTELTEVMLGLQQPVAGSVQLDGVELVGKSVKDVLDAGLGFVPEDRSTDGVIAGLLHRGEPHPRPAPARAVRPRSRAQARRRAGERREADRRVRRPHRLDRRPREHPVRRQPAEGRAGARDVRGRCGCSSPRSPPVASTSARSSSCTPGSCRSATTAPR